MKGPAPLFVLFDELRDVLGAAGVPYAVMGGVAVAHWGLPHYTHDLDIAIGVSAERVAGLLRALDDAGFIVPDQFRAGWTDRLAGTRKLVVKKFIDGHVWDVDVFLEDSEFLRSVLARRVTAQIAGRPTPLITPEDLVLFKLVAWRRKDQAHLDDLLLVVGPLDDAYLASWADRLGVRDRLVEQWKRSGRELRA